MKKIIFSLIFASVAFASFGQIILDPTASTSSATRMNQIISGSFPTTGVDTYSVNFTGSYSYTALTGQAISITVPSADVNTGSSTLNFDGLGDKNIQKWESGSLVDVVAGDLIGTVRLRYDGTQFVMEGGTSSGGGGSSTWGAITGTLSDQTDLQSELDDKLSLTLPAPRTVDLNGFDLTLGGGGTTLNVSPTSVTMETASYQFSDAGDVGTDREFMKSDNFGTVEWGEIETDDLVPALNVSRTATSSTSTLQSDNLHTVYLNGAFNITVDALTDESVITYINIGAGTITLVNGTATVSGPTTIAAGSTLVLQYETTTAPLALAGSSGTVTSVSGTTNRITSTGGTTPVIDISATFEALLGKVASPLSQFAATTSAQLRGVLSDELGTGAALFDGATPTSLVGTNFTGIPYGALTGTAPFWALTGTSTFTGAVTIAGSASNTLKHTFTSLGTTQTDGAGQWLSNTTAAAAGAQQRSPSLVFEGNGWKTTATAASQSVKFLMDVLPVQGTTAPSGALGVYSSINNAAYSATPLAQFESGGRFTVFAGGDDIEGISYGTASGRRVVLSQNNTSATSYVKGMANTTETWFVGLSNSTTTEYRSAVATGVTIRGNNGDATQTDVLRLNTSSVSNVLAPASGTSRNVITSSIGLSGASGGAASEMSFIKYSGSLLDANTGTAAMAVFDYNGTINTTSGSRPTYFARYRPTVTATAGAHYGVVIEAATALSGFASATPVSTLESGRSFGANITTISTSSTLDASHYTVLVDANAAPITIALPAASGCTRRVYIIKKIDASANNVTVDGNASEVIDSATTRLLTGQWNSMTIQSNGTAWYVLNAF